MFSISISSKVVISQVLNSNQNCRSQNMKSDQQPARLLCMVYGLNVFFRPLVTRSTSEIQMKCFQGILYDFQGRRAADKKESGTYCQLSISGRNFVKWISSMNTGLLICWNGMHGKCADIVHTGHLSQFSFKLVRTFIHKLYIYIICTINHIYMFTHTHI